MRMDTASIACGLVYRCARRVRRSCCRCRTDVDPDVAHLVAVVERRDGQRPELSNAAARAKRAIADNVRRMSP
jgi:hypothetical protein